MIRLHFPNPLDSPTQATPVRVRYAIERCDGRPVPALRYAHGTRELTREAWRGFESCGARVECDTPREAGIVAEALDLAQSSIDGPASTAVESSPGESPSNQARRNPFESSQEPDA